MKTYQCHKRVKAAQIQSRPHMAESAETLAAIGLAIAKRRDDAKTARSSSGIEATWKESRGSLHRHRRRQPGRVPGRPLGQADVDGWPGHDWEDAAPARAQIDRLRPPDRALCRRGLGQARRDPSAGRRQGVLVLRDAGPGTDQGQGRHQPGRAQRLGVPLTRPARRANQCRGFHRPGIHGCASARWSGPRAWRSRCASLAGTADSPVQHPHPQASAADRQGPGGREHRDRAQVREGGGDRIYDWMVECQHAAEMRKVIDDAARIGVGVLKGPIPAAKKHWRSRNPTAPSRC
jgi:hypothetical protein